MRKATPLGLTVLMVGTVSTAFVLLASMETVEARPQYKKAFEKKYGDTIKEVDCKICHPGGEKKQRNDYAKAFSKGLKKNEKNAEKIDEALDRVAKQKSKIEGKTYGELIAEGKRPDSSE
jgi:hypothetical protein